MTKAKLAEIKKIASKHGVSYLYLFGSVAKGKSTHRSDLDFAVKFNPKQVKDAFLARLKLLGELNALYERDDIDLVDLARANPLFGYNIIKDGVLLYEQDKRTRVLDNVRAFSFYFDRKRSYERHFSRQLEKYANIKT